MPQTVTWNSPAVIDCFRGRLPPQIFAFVGKVNILRVQHFWGLKRFGGQKGPKLTLKPKWTKKNPETAVPIIRKKLGTAISRQFGLARANGCGGFGSQTAADPSGDPGRTRKSRLWALWQHLTKYQPCKHSRALSMLALQREAAWAEDKLLGSPLAVCPPERPRPFTRYRFGVILIDRERIQISKICDSEWGVFGKDFYRKGNSVKRSGRFSEPLDPENWKVAVLIP